MIKFTFEQICFMKFAFDECECFLDSSHRYWLQNNSVSMNDQICLLSAMNSTRHLTSTDDLHTLWDTTDHRQW